MNEQNDLTYLTDSEPTSHKRHKPPKRKIYRVIKTVAIVLLCIVLVASAAFVSMYFIGRNRIRSGTGLTQTVSELDTAIEDDGRTVIHNGVKYTLNENIVSILCLGTDVENMITSTDTIGENGQADAIYLVAIDVQTGKIDVIGISRDTMVDVDVYSLSGHFIRTENMQLCLAYAYGDGRTSSCKNTARSVSRLMYGMPIDNFYTVDFGTLPILNDAVGGITLTSLITMHFPNNGRYIYEGETITLHGKEALWYLRERDTGVLESNIPRMQRQQQYLTAFSRRVLEMTKKDISTPVNLLNLSSQYAVTDIDAAELVYLTTAILTNNASGDLNFRMVEGEVVMGEKYAEFHHDEEKLYELILDTFYIRDENTAAYSDSLTEQ